MPLIQATLQNALQGVLTSRPPAAATSAQQMAQAYYAYASLGLFGASVPTILPSAIEALKNSLAGAIAQPRTGSAVQFAQAWSTGLLAFWLTPPVTVTGPQSGVVTLVPGAALLVTPLTAAMLNTKATAASAAQSIAAILHTATLTVTAIVAPPPATILTLL